MPSGCSERRGCSPTSPASVPCTERSETLWAHWTDPRASAIIAVALAAEMPVNETLDLEQRLHDQLGRGVDLVVANGLYPKKFTGPEVEALAALNGRADAVGPGVKAAAAAARSQASRVKLQQSQLRRLKKDAEAPVATLPYLFEPELDVDDVEHLAAALSREL